MKIAFSAVALVLAALFVRWLLRMRWEMKLVRKERDILYRNCHLSGLAGLLAKMAVADGHVDDSEIRVADRLFDALKLSEDNRAACRAAYRAARENDLPGEYYASLFVPFSSPEQRRRAYDVLKSVASADGIVTAAENEFLALAAVWLRLEGKEVAQ